MNVSQGSLTPINEFIVKVASRCNLDCDYCYEYNTGDSSWRDMPKFMSNSTCEYLAARIAEHAAEHRLADVFVTFHGGEPLLAGPARLKRYAQIFEGAGAEAGVKVRFSIQTNATLVTDSVCDFIRDHNVAVSVSLDGNREANDRHRLDKLHHSTYESTRAGIKLLQQRVGSLLTGILAVIDLQNDPIEVFDELAALGVKDIDFLLPHFNWNRPPPREHPESLEYGLWYWKIFLAWTRGRHPHTNIRFFVNIISQLLGRGGVYEAMNLAPASLITISTAGDYEAVDCIKSAGAGAQVTGMTVRRNSVTDIISHPSIQVRQSGEQQLSAKCLSCDVKNVCGGGYFPHRFSESNGFDNPSVYCQDLKWLITETSRYIRGRGCNAA
ncbi:FxsB family cyclophane-forming radical SAM/SPASM peptide maturase [Paraburkholderia sp. RL17-347-BIC-D]|uniref:FxsB family cyclophane-forming radical SAM/SPASM peptide maturase n=1 Tax=Paraburkholderia sp. RL17-347-BIC-D TaxID=3031632 RepID=UPI0038B6C222